MNKRNVTKPILLIDGYHLLHKGYYGTLKRKKLATNKDGIVINAIYAFVANILKFVNSQEYHTIIVAFDVDGACWRSDLYPNYKAKRKPTPSDLIPQMQIAREFLTAINIPWYEKSPYEGDDIIGTISRTANKLGYDVRILSNDKDIYQLVNDKTYVISNISKKEKTYTITPKEVYEYYSCKPNQVADIKALLGDPSDNIKGIRYMRRKQAYMLIDQFGHIENIVKNINKISTPLKNTIKDNVELLFKNKKITTILTNVDLKRINFRPTRISYFKLLKFLKQQEMYRFIRSVKIKIQEINKIKIQNQLLTNTKVIKPVIKER